MASIESATKKLPTSSFRETNENKSKSLALFPGIHA